MSTLQLKKSDAIRAYKNGDASRKQFLEELYGKEVFNQKITEQVTCFDDICLIAGVDPAKYKVTDGMDDEERFVIYSKRVRLIAKVLNEGAELSWKNANQKKWIPIFYWNGAGFGVSGSLCGYGRANSYVGSRFASQELSDFAAKVFAEDFINYYNAQ